MELQPYELQRLLRRHNEIRRAMRQPGGVRVTMERELNEIDQRLKTLWQQRKLPTDSTHTISRR
ncbi:MAG TPA: hypothetical protein VGL28_04070 [Steroidobacteraceae bacterium]|jgi:hypothetical protein